MSAIARLWVKWILDETKPHSVDMVPKYWKKEVEEEMERIKRITEEEKQMIMATPQNEK